ncbi:MAG: 50S ribosomal protein L6 [Spirochaetes bacterium]|nr:MAG: 50S ribosomal protein L6 [Spirochaetota bacterium]
MSRIGKLPVKILQGVKVDVDADRVKVEGPKGKLEQKFTPEVSVSVEDNKIVVHRKSESRRAKAFHGLYRKLISNMVDGVTRGFSKTLVINGVGYRAELRGKSLILNLGFSNPIEYPIPDDLTVTCEGNNKIIISGIDKQRVGQVSAEIRSFRPPEPYKGKGVKYENEIIRRKIGKSGIK